MLNKLSLTPKQELMILPIVLLMFSGIITLYHNVMLDFSTNIMTTATVNNAFCGEGRRNRKGDLYIQSAKGIEYRLDPNSFALCKDLVGQIEVGSSLVLELRKGNHRNVISLQQYGESLVTKDHYIAKTAKAMDTFRKFLYLGVAIRLFIVLLKFVSKKDLDRR